MKKRLILEKDNKKWIFYKSKSEYYKNGELDEDRTLDLIDLCEPYTTPAGKFLIRILFIMANISMIFGLIRKGYEIQDKLMEEL